MTAPRKWDTRMCELHDRLSEPTITLTALDLRELSAGIDGLRMLLESVRMQASHAFDTGSATGSGTTLAARILDILGDGGRHG